MNESANATMRAARLMTYMIEAKGLGRQFAYAPDTPNLYGKLKAIEYLRFMAQLYRVPAEEADERIKQQIEKHRSHR